MVTEHEIQAWADQAEAGYDVEELKHGVAELDAVQAAEWSLWIEPLGDDGPPHRDTDARLLETVVLILEDGAELVIHAMPSGKKYLDLLT